MTLKKQKQTYKKQSKYTLLAHNKNHNHNRNLNLNLNLKLNNTINKKSNVKKIKRLSRLNKLYHSKHKTRHNNNNKKNRTNNLINKLIINHNLSLRQDGGMFFLDYIALKRNIKKFNKIITKINIFDEKIQNSIVSYTNQLEIFKTQATEKATILTELLNNYRQKIIFKIYAQDKIEHIDTNKTDKLNFNDSIKTLDDHILSLLKRSNQVDKEMLDIMPSYNNLMNKLKTNMKEFNVITTQYSNESGFYQKIKTLKHNYDIIIKNVRKQIAPDNYVEAYDTSVNKNNTIDEILSVSEKKALTRYDIAIVKKFENNRAQYMKIYNMNDSAVQTRKNVEKSIMALMTDAEYYLSQFSINNNSTSISTSKNKLKEQMNFIDCTKGGKLCEWKDCYEQFADKLLDVGDKCKDIIINLKKIEYSTDACVFQLQPIIKDYKSDPHPEAMVRMRADIIDIREIVELISNSIAQLKAQFYNQTPATRLLYDYNEITADLYYIEDKLYKYYKIFNEIKELNQEYENSYNSGMYGGASASASAATGSTTPTPTTPTLKNIPSPEFTDIQILKDTFNTNSAVYIDYKLLEDIIKLLEDIFYSVLGPLFNDQKKYSLEFNNYNKIFVEINEAIKNTINIDTTKLNEYIQTLQNIEKISKLIPDIKTLIDKINASDNIVDKPKTIKEMITLMSTAGNTDDNQIYNKIEAIKNKEYKKLKDTKTDTKTDTTKTDTTKTDTKTDTKTVAQDKIDNNLIQHILKTFNDPKYENYKIQKENIKDEFINIKDELIELVEDKEENPIKTIANLTAELTKLLQDIKRIEPEIVKIEVKENKSIDIPLAGWIVKKADTDFNALQKLDITSELKAKRLKNREIQKIYDPLPKAGSDSDMQKLITSLITPNFNYNTISSNNTYLEIFTDINLFKNLLEKITKDYPPNATTKENINACTILDNIKNKVIGGVNPKQTTLYEDTRKLYECTKSKQTPLNKLPYYNPAQQPYPYYYPPPPPL